MALAAETLCFFAFGLGLEAWRRCVLEPSAVVPRCSEAFDVG